VAERAPLTGVTVAVTRARAQAAELADRLRVLGATVIELPVIEIVDPDDGGAGLTSALEAARHGVYDWLVVTSTNGAERVLTAFGEQPAAQGTRVAAIGPATAAVLEAGGIVVDVVPDRYVAEALVDAIPPPSDGDRGRVLVARAAVARDVLPEGLRAKGWVVDVVDAYRTRRGSPSNDARTAAARAEVITFTSPSTVDGAITLLGVDRLPPVVACIGPVTAAAARANGLAVTIEAGTHTIPGLVDAVAGWARDTRN
jgi:uroporphyrinogen-III synthase